MDHRHNSNIIVASSKEIKSSDLGILAIVLLAAISCSLMAEGKEVNSTFLVPIINIYNNTINSSTEHTFFVELSGYESANWSLDQNQSSRTLNCSENQTLENESYTNETRKHIDAPTWNRYGLRAYKWGYANYSIQYFSRSINQSPDFVDPWNNMGVSLIALQNYSEAIQCFDRALELSHSDATILWNNKGVALYRMGKLQEASDCFNRSLKSNPYSSPAFNNQGAVMATRKSDEKAIELYTKSISSDMYNKVAWSNKGRSLLTLRRYNEAWDCLHNALILDKDYTLAWINMADYYRLVGDAKNYQGALIIIRMQGYNGSASTSPAEAQAVMMEDKVSVLSGVVSNSIPAVGCTAVVFGLLSVWAIHRIGKKR
jgi:Tfp pilus assembly protein PilF